MQLITLVDGSDHIGSVKAGYHSLVHLDSNPSTSPYPVSFEPVPRCKQSAGARGGFSDGLAALGTLQKRVWD